MSAGLNIISHRRKKPQSFYGKYFKLNIDFPQLNALLDILYTIYVPTCYTKTGGKGAYKLRYHNKCFGGVFPKKFSNVNICVYIIYYATQYTIYVK